MSTRARRTGGGNGGPGEEEGTQAAEDQQGAELRFPAGKRDPARRRGARHARGGSAPTPASGFWSTGPPSGNRLGSASSVSARPISAQRRADRHPGQPPVARRLRRRVQQVADQRGADDADRQARGTAALERRRRRATGTTGRGGRLTTHATRSRSVIGDGGAGGEQWGHVVALLGCALDASLKRSRASRLARIGPN